MSAMQSLFLKDWNNQDLQLLLCGGSKIMTRHSAEELVKVIKEFTKEKQGYIPKVVLVSPPEIGKDIANSEFARSFDEDAIIRSRELSVLYERIAKKYGCIFFDAAKVVESSRVDSLHLMPEAHKKLAEAFYDRISF